MNLDGPLKRIRIKRTGLISFLVEAVAHFPEHIFNTFIDCLRIKRHPFFAFP